MSTNPFLLRSKRKKQINPFLLEEEERKNIITVPDFNKILSKPDEVDLSKLTRKTEQQQKVEQLKSDFDPYTGKYSPGQYVLGLLNIGISPTARFVDTLITSGYAAFGKALANAGEEAVGILTANAFSLKAKKETFSDIINKHNPEWAQSNRFDSTILGLIADIALDPITYISFGTASIPRLSGKTLSRTGIKTVKGLNRIAKEEDIFAGIIDIGKGVTQEIIIGPQRIKLLKEIEREAGEEVANKSLNDYLSHFGKPVDLRKLEKTEIPQAVEKDFLDLVKRNPKLILEGTPVNFKVPFGPRFSVSLPRIKEESQLGKSISSIRENLKTSLPVQAVRKGFSRNGLIEDLGKQGEEYLDIRNGLEGELNRTEYVVSTSIEDLFVGVKSDRRIKLTQLVQKMDDTLELQRNTYLDILESSYTVQNIQDLAGKYKRIADNVSIDIAIGKVGDKIVINIPGKSTIAIDPKITNPQDILKAFESFGLQRIDSIKPSKNYIKSKFLPDEITAQERSRVLNNALSKGDIDEKEFSTLSKFISASNYISTLEVESQLYKQGVKNARPDLLLGKVDDLLIDGQIPELDLAVFYALRLRTALRNKSFARFEDSLDFLFGDVSEKTGKLIRRDVPDVIKKDIQFIHNSIYPNNVDTATKELLQIYDKGLNAFKKLATVVKPSFGVRQAIGNTLMAYAGIGAKALKGFDPRTVIDTFILLSDKASFRKTIPQRLVDNVRKYGTTKTGEIVSAVNKYEPALVERIKYTDALGQTITGQKFFDELIDNNIVRKGQILLDIDTAHNLRLELAKDVDFVEFQKTKIKESTWKTGYSKFVEESIPWINVAGHIESLGRANLYIQSRLLGMSEDAATRTVNRVLADYQNGLSVFERKFMKRIIPFYTFQRFAIPLIASLIKTPGRAVNLQKTSEAFFEVWNKIAGGERLTPDEREVLPGYLLEQPNVFESFQDTQNGKKNAIFRTFNNFTFTDILSLIVTKPNGELDITKTVQKMSLAQITPVLKVPLEVLFDKNFFTGRVVSQSGKVTSGDYVDRIESTVPEWIRDLMQYETRINPRTGQEIGYVNPYITHVMSGFVPAINDFVTLTRDDLDSRDFALRYLGGVGKLSLNLPTEKSFRIKELRETELADLQRKFRRAIQSGNKTASDELQIKLQQLILQIGKKANLQVRE